MTTSDQSATERYFYRSVAANARHRSRVSAYLVERFRGSKVVARIEPLGLMHTTISDQQMALHRLRRDLVACGTWQLTPSQHHLRIRVTSSRPGPSAKVAPRSP